MDPYFFNILYAGKNEPEISEARLSAYFLAFCGAVLGGLTVVLGAFGAHALKAVLDSNDIKIWEKAVFYQAFHSLVLLVLPGYAKMMSQQDINIFGFTIILGTLLFSGSLYLFAITGKKYFATITPIGGITFLAGWVWLAASLFEASF